MSRVGPFSQVNYLILNSNRVAEIIATEDTFSILLSEWYLKE